MNNSNYGTPPGFWEVYNREKSTCFYIQIQKQKLESEKVVFSGNIPTSFFYTLNRTKLYLKANFFIHKLIEDIITKKELFIYSKNHEFKALCDIPTLRYQLVYLIKTISYLFKKLARKILKKRLIWSVAYQYCNDWNNVSMEKLKIIKNPKNSFLADPFLFSHKEKDYCFVEEFDFLNNRGHISVFEINDMKEKFLGIALKEEFHLSYPNIFEENGEIFMIPETSSNKDIRLYKCVEFPLKWKLNKVLISNKAAVDSNLFKLNNKWWLLTNIDSSDSGEYCSELHAYYSNNLESNNWIPHKKNPLIFDSSCARNGGVIFEKDNIYRVYQIQGWDRYGEGLGVAKIITLNENEYTESLKFELSSDFFSDAMGTHTYNFNNGIMVTDFVSFKSI